MLELTGVAKSYGETLLFQNVDARLTDGEYLAVMGESGSGKSTLLNLIAGLDRADRGRLEVDGIDPGGLDDDAVTHWRRRALGFVFQSFHVLPYLTVAQNVALPLRLNSWSEADVRQRVAEMLEAVGLAGRHDRHARELSGGETQRVAIARALAHRPRLLLADEPTGNLDPRTAASVLALLAAEIRRNGATGVLVTHSPLAAKTADRVLTLTRDGLGPPHAD
jgi:putative ABC transport system ATP-binding protein